MRLFLLGMLALGAGCTGTRTQTVRPQSNDDPNEHIARACVGDKTVVGNVEPIPVSAVGLVWKLNGTGSAASGEWRAMLERDLRKKKLPNINHYLDDPGRTTSLVLVSAVIPAGARKGDMIDIDVTLPRGTGTTSLKGGMLLECDLATSEESGNVRNNMIKSGQEVGASPVMGNTLLIGRTLVRAEGPLVVGTNETTAKLKVKIEGDAAPEGFTVGRVWGGGKVLEDRSYYFILNEPSSRMAMEIAERLNATFQVGADARVKVANAVNANVVSVNVPGAYRLNHTRFLTVARQVTLLPAAMDSLYRKELEVQLLEPSTAILAAVKLEALGAESQQPLRVALQHPSPWVRFAAAESLAYLGNTAAAGELARLAELHPALRTHALLALATLDDGVSTDRLVELMNHPDVQVRYGAFTALRSANDRHLALNGKHLKKTFWVHHVAPDSQPLVHLTTHSRAEVVLFGKVGELVPPFSIPLGAEFTVTAAAGDANATLTKIVPGLDGPQAISTKCPLSMVGVLSAIGEAGGGYAEAVELVRRAEQAKVMPAGVAIDAAPTGVSTVQLATMARSDANLERANLEVARLNRGDLMPVSYDMPNAEDPKPLPPVEPIDLNRNPGRIFGVKKHPMDVEEEAKPAPAAAPVATPNTPNRSPGKLFGK